MGERDPVAERVESRFAAATAVTTAVCCPLSAARASILSGSA